MTLLLPPPAPGTLPHFLLWMGDSGLATVVTAAMVLALALHRTTRGLAGRWAGVFVGVTALVFATKLGLFGWGEGIAALDFRGPSGHATLSAFVWPLCARLLTMRAGRSVRRAAGLVGMALAAGTAWVLVTHGFHSGVEVAAGSLLGGGAAWACIRHARAIEPPRPGITLLAAVLIASSVGLQHGRELPALVRFKWKAHEMMARSHQEENARFGGVTHC